MDDKEKRKLLGFANGNINVVADIGNARVKMGTDASDKMAGRLKIDHFTHAIVETSKSVYDDLCYRHKTDKAYHFLKWDGRYFIIGDDAYNYDPTFDPKRGRLKYSKDYMGLLFIAGLLRQFGDNMPETVNALVAHPPADLNMRETLMRSIVGRWQFESNKIKYDVRVEYINVFDEIFGGLFNTTISPDGEPYADPEKDMSGATLIFDLGGGTLDFAIAVNGRIDYSRTMESTRIGANGAVEAFKRDFDHAHPNLVSNYEDGIPRNLVHQVFLQPEHLLELAAGETLDCKALYQRAINPVISKAYDAVQQYAGNMMGIRRVMLDGGVSGLMYLDICKNIFPKYQEKGAILLAERREDMLIANARGGVKMLEGMKAESIKRFKAAKR